MGCGRVCRVRTLDKGSTVAWNCVRMLYCLNEDKRLAKTLTKHCVHGIILKLLSLIHGITVLHGITKGGVQRLGILIALLLLWINRDDGGFLPDAYLRLVNRWCQLSFSGYKYGPQTLIDHPWWRHQSGVSKDSKRWVSEQWLFKSRSKYSSQCNVKLCNWYYLYFSLWKSYLF